MITNNIIETAPENELIRNTFKKADLLLENYKNPVCSVSGGSDSDIVLDLLEKIRNGRKIIYVWYDTGLEFEATKRHLDFLEEKYNIKILREKALVPVPSGCKKYGIPFLSKEISSKINTLQTHGFDFKDPNPDIENCQSASQWFSANDKSRTKFDVNRNFKLKEFLMDNPPPVQDF